MNHVSLGFGEKLEKLEIALKNCLTLKEFIESSTEIENWYYK